MDRRTSLPGIDELFGSTGARIDRPPSDEDRAGRTSREVLELTEAREAVRRLTADEAATMRAAREAAAGVDGVPAPEVGALLRWVATSRQVRTVVEIGSVGGVSGLWLLEALPRGGVLTSLEPDSERRRLAVDAFAAAGVGTRVRSIEGDPSTLLERLADASYDLVLLQTDQAAYPAYLAAARKLLRPGGVLLARGCLPVGEHRDVLARFLHELVEDPLFDTVVLPFDDGLAIANVRDDVSTDQA